MDTKKAVNERQENKINRKLYYLELCIWIIGAVLCLLRFFFYVRMDSYGYDIPLFDAALTVTNYNILLLSLLIFLVPLLFQLIFGQLPFEYLRNRKIQPKGIKIENSKNISVIIENDERLVSEKSLPEQTYEESCINESKNIAERIFSKSGVYLLVGCLIAFTGVAIFYSPLFSSTPSADLTQRLLEYIPRFGALFFIEFVAFFFLKQYRIMLEEYRYYEAIKRKRQDNFILVTLIEKYKDNPELLKTIVDKVTQTTITKLTNGETTEILETQKIINQDMDIFSKLTDLVKEIKSK